MKIASVDVVQAAAHGMSRGTRLLLNTSRDQHTAPHTAPHRRTYAIPHCSKTCRAQTVLHHTLTWAPAPLALPP